eukprot:272468_1
MSNCLVCGIEKIKSITNTLKNKSVQANLYYNDDINTNAEQIECIDINDITECKAAQQLLNFIHIYTEQGHINYVDILSKLKEKETYSLIISKSFNNTNTDLLLPMFENDTDDNNIKLDGNKLCCISEEELISMVHGLNQNVPRWSIEEFYKSILTECDKYALSQQENAYNLSYLEITKIW